MKILSTLLIAGAMAAGALTVWGEDGGPGDVSATSTSTIDDIGLGTHWYGPELTVEKLRGKVVLLEPEGLRAVQTLTVDSGTVSFTTPSASDFDTGHVEKLSATTLTVESDVAWKLTIAERAAAKAA